MAQRPADAELVRRCRQGERAAVEELLGRYEKYIYCLCRSVLGRHEDALDATQEVLLKVFEHLGTFDVTQPLTPWVRRIALNTALSELRRRRPELSLEDQVARLGQEPAASTNVEREVEEREGLQHLRRELAALPPLQRAVFFLRHFEDLSYEDISAACALPLGTVKTYLFRGRRQLKEKVGAFLAGGADSEV